MYMLTNYGGAGLQVVTPDPPDAGGAAINDNFKSISDALDGDAPIAGLTVEGTIAASPAAANLSPLVLSASPDKNAAVSLKARASDVATLTTAIAHGFFVGESVTVAVGDATFDGTFAITAVGSATAFSYASTGIDVNSEPASGTAAVTQAGDLASFRNGSNAVLANVDASGNVGTPQLLVEATSAFTQESYHLSTASVTTTSTTPTTLFTIPASTAGLGLVGWINVRCVAVSQNISLTAYFERRYLIQSDSIGVTITDAGTPVTTTGADGFTGTVASSNAGNDFSFIVTAPNTQTAVWRCTYEYQFITGLPT